jgi:lactoylglutathione lyase
MVKGTAKQVREGQSMRIEHIALWTRDLERLKGFYVEFFQGHASPKYINHETRFESYFIEFEPRARLELMYRPDIVENRIEALAEGWGYIHLAMAVGSREKVDALTSRLEQAGYPVVSRPRITGDGYYESCILDPEGNRVEITV